MEKLPVRLLAILSFLVIGAATILALKTPRTAAPNLPIRAAEVFSTPSPTPPSVMSISAPDGKMILKVREEKVSGGAKKAFSILTKDGKLAEIYSIILTGGQDVTVPFNTFSPDDKYIFLKKTGPDQPQYLVFSTSGKALVESGNVEVTSLFYDKYSDYKVTDITGWGGESLLVINTDNASGGQGPSFWFEVPTHAFIRLSNRFN